MYEVSLPLAQKLMRRRMRMDERESVCEIVIERRREKGI